MMDNPPQAPAERDDSPRGGPSLTRAENRKAEAEAPLNADLTYEMIRRRGQDELLRPSAALFFSGLAAGLSMGFSLVAEGLLQAYMPDVPWRPLVTKLGYSVGFLMITLGSQQLFTENTLTAIIPLLSRRTGSAFMSVCRLWGVVLAANLIGALVFAVVVAHTSIFEPPVPAAFHLIGMEASHGSFSTLFVQGIFAGWLIAMMVWMLPAAQSDKAVIVILMTYLIGIGGFPHIIAGSVEVLYVVVTGEIPWSDYLLRYAPATLLGNILGGVALVSALNYAQVFAGSRAGELERSVRPPPRR